MRKIIRNFAKASLLAALVTLTACGGGGDSSDASGPATSTADAPPTSGAATAVLTADAQTASRVVTAAQAGAASVEKIDGFSGLPFGVQVAAPTGVITTETQACGGGGSFVLTADTASTSALTTGDTMRMVFSACAEEGVAFSGTVALKVSRAASDNDFAFSFDATNLLVSGGGLDRGPFSFSGHIDYSGSGTSFSYIVDGNTVIGSPVLTRSGNTVSISSATTRSNLGQGSGFVEVQLSNWQFDRSTGRPTAGTATIRAANGDTGIVTVTATGYQVDLVISGVSTRHTVGF